MNTHIWRYRDDQRNYRGYHLSADSEGCAALLQWLRSSKGRTDFHLQPVTQAVIGVPNHQGDLSACESCNIFMLHIRPDAASGHFLVTEKSGRLSLECSPQQVERLIKGVEDIQRGEGDYRIGEGGNQVLWFWWYPRG
jgi:hypothetical protein